MGVYVSGSIYINPNPFLKKGEGVKGDVHKHDHTTIIIHGVFYVLVTDVEGRTVQDGYLIAGDHLLVLAHHKHTFIAQEDNSHFICVYSHRNHQGEVILQYNGLRDSYV